MLFDLQEGEMVLDVLFIFQDVSFKVHECTRVRFGSQRRFGQNILWDPFQEGHYALIIPTLCSNAIIRVSQQ